jgi:transcriptional regulator with GAF, ATPase, and Fis domain
MKSNRSKTHPDLLVRVWQEVSRHLELAAVLDTLIETLKPVVDIKLIDVLKLDVRRCDLESITIARRDRIKPMPGRRIGLTREQFDALMRWCRTERLAFAHAKTQWPAALAPLQEFHAASDVMIAVLGHPAASGEAASMGIVVIAAKRGTLNEDAEALLADLIDPLSAAFENDARLRELVQLRAAAEADRQSLLHRLGREKLSDEIIGAQGGLRQVLTRVDQVARSDSSVLLLGETGSGKEVIARAVHDRSLRAGAPFIRVNCGAIAPELIDSELFGHEKGSFTGAFARRRGWFEQADGGTLFLDEVGELPPPVQVRLLRVLQDGSLYRLGSEQAIHVDVRVIAATHRDLAAMVREGGFREDLWYRIAVFPILIPPLRDRLEDIPALAQHFARRASLKLGLHPQPPTESDIALLSSYAWPGNVREMASVIERAAILGEGHRLEIATALGLSSQPRRASERSSGGQGEFATLDQAMIEHIHAALTRTRGKIEGPRGAARLLGINPYTLRSRMRKLGVDPRPFREL